MAEKAGQSWLSGLGRAIGTSFGNLLLKQAAKGAAADMDGVAGILFALLTGIWPYRKRVIRRNGEIAFGYQGKALDAFLLNFYRHFADMIAEILASFSMTAEQVKARMTWESAEFEESVRTNPLTMALTSHQGNWEWQLVGGGLYYQGYLLGVYQPLSQSFFESVMFQLRSKGGALPTPQKQILRQLASLPKNQNSILAMVADQRPGLQGAMVLPFLDTSTGFYSGPQQLAARMRAPSFYLSMLPGKFPHTYHTVSRPLRVGHEVEDYVKLLEADIRAYPHTYLWSHNRFKLDYQDTNLVSN